MPLIRSRIPFTPQRPFRNERPAVDKILFLSLEGSVTEEEYFLRVGEIFSEIKTKIQFISVAEDAVFTAPKYRTQEQIKVVSKGRPLQLVERIDQFREKMEEKYQFSQYPHDEFWIVTDVDNNWSDVEISSGKTLLDEWNEAVALCEEKGYGYAVSNPFFEMWLLLHHDDPIEEDKAYAVTEEHAYEKTDHFKVRFKNLGVPLKGKGKDKKHISFSDYNMQKIVAAVQRAEMLHKDKEDLCPKYFATTVYLLLKKMMNALSGDEQE